MSEPRELPPDPAREKRIAERRRLLKQQAAQLGVDMGEAKPIREGGDA